MVVLVLFSELYFVVWGLLLLIVVDMVRYSFCDADVAIEDLRWPIMLLSRSRGANWKFMKKVFS